MPLWLFVLLPVAVGVGALISVTRRPGPVTTSAIQHFTAGVVFAAAAGEILPDLKHQGFWPVIMGSAAGVVAMLAVKRLNSYTGGSLGLLVAVAVDLLVDGLVLGLGFVAGQREGLLLTVALTWRSCFSASPSRPHSANN